MDLSFLYGATGGGVVGLISVALGAVAVCYVKRLMVERDKLTEKQADALKEKVDDNARSFALLQMDFQRHKEADKSQVILNELKNISGTQLSQSAVITGMAAEVKELLISDGKQSEKVDSLDRYIKGVDASLREHKNNHLGGRHG